jgi:hypothetical protein
MGFDSAQFDEKLSFSVINMLYFKRDKITHYK